MTDLQPLIDDVARTWDAFQKATAALHVASTAATPVKRPLLPYTTDPEWLSFARTTLAARFERDVIRQPGCWGWRRPLSGRYPELRYGGHSGRGGLRVLASRFSYETFVGPLADSDLVMHTCDNPTCTNPEHLRVGTHLDNSRDMVQKGRAGRAR